MDSDLRLGQIAVRMGVVSPEGLPRLLQEARRAREVGGHQNALAQLLIRRKLCSVSDYLYMARQAAEVEESTEGPTVEQLQDALVLFESGEIDGRALAQLQGERIEKPTDEAGRFGPYELLGEIARGGMGIVYRSRDPGSGRPVALKVMIEADDDEVRLKRFEREAELAAALDHPNIVRIHDAGRVDGIPYFTMDLVEGRSLDDLLEGEGVVRDVAIRALAQVARAADHAHERGIVHRDLKPGNVILDAAGDAHITDFGLARDLARMTRLTQVGQAVGTPYYMAPEQVRGERDVDGRADVYAVGVMLYEVLTGDIPFDADSPLSLFKKIDKEPLELAVDPAKGINERIHAIVTRALAKEREDRYARGRLLAEDLERYLRGQPPKAQPREWLEGLRAMLRHKLAVAAAALAILALATLGLAGTIGYRRYRDRSAAADGRERVVAALADRRVELEAARHAVAGGDDAEAARIAGEALRALERSLGPLLAQDGPGGRGAKAAFVEEDGEDVERGLRKLLARALARQARTDPEGAGPPADRALAGAIAADPDDVELRLLRAAVVLDLEGPGPAARELLDEAVERAPRDPRALVARAELRLALGRTVEASADLSDALLADPDDVAALVTRARAYVALGRLDAAEADAERAAGLAPDATAPRVALGDVARARGERARAEAAYRGAAALDADASRPLARLAELELAAGAFEAAAAAATAAAERGGGGPAELVAARAAAARFDLTAAAAAVERALTAPAPPARRAGVRAAALTLQAELALARGDTAAARSALVEAAAADPSAVAPRVWTARLLLRADPPEAAAARAVVEEARGILADAPGPLTVLADVELALGDEAAARELAERALAASGGGPSPRAWSALARARLAGASPAPAARAACEAAWRDATGGDLAGALLAQAEDRVALGGAYGADALLDDAEALLGAAVGLDAGRARTRAAEGALRLARGDPARAFVAFTAARRLHPFRVELAAGLARAALAAPTLGRTEAALGALEATARDATAVEHRLRAGCLVELERWDEALAALDVAADLGPDDPSLAAERAAVLEAAGRTAAARRARERAEARRGERVRRRRELAATAAEAAPRAPGRARELLEEALDLCGDPQSSLAAQELLLRAARLEAAPVGRVTALARLLALRGRDLLDRADAELAREWTRPLPLPARDVLRRRARRGPRGALALAVAALLDGLAGAEDAHWLAAGLEAAERAVAAYPEAIAPRLARAYLRVHTGAPRRALRELRLLEAVAPTAPLVELVAAEAHALTGDAAARDEALVRARREGLPSYAERVRRSGPLDGAGG